MGGATFKAYTCTHSYIRQLERPKGLSRPSKILMWEKELIFLLTAGR